MSRNHLLLLAMAALCAGLYWAFSDIDEPAAPSSSTGNGSSVEEPTTQHALSPRAADPVDDSSAPATNTPVARSAPIIGQVLGPDGRPVHDAIVRYGAAARVVTDPEGRFRLLASSRQPLLQVTAEGLAEAAVAGIAPGSEVVVVLDEQTTLRGWLVCARTGQPVAGGWVEVKNAAVVRAVRAGQDGSFAIDKLPPGRALLVAGGARHELIRRAGFFPSQQSEPLTLQLPPAGTVSGRVVSQETGRGVAGKEITHASGGTERGNVRTVRTDTDGSFDFGIAPTANAELRVFDNDRAKLIRTLVPSDRDRPLELQLPSQASPATIRVVEDGRPKRGVVVICRQGSQQQRLTTDRQGVVEAAVDSSRPVMLSCRTAYASASLTWLPQNSEEATLELQTYASIEIVADGGQFVDLPVLVETRNGIFGSRIDDSNTCRIDNLPIGTATVLLGHQRLVVHKAMLRPGQLEHVELSDQDLTSITLRVTDETGAPLAGTRWSLHQRGNARLGTAQGFTSANGQAEVTAYHHGELHVTRPGYRPSKLDIAPDESGLRIVTLQPDRNVLGQVIDQASGRAIQEFTVICLPQQTEHTYWSPSGAFDLTTPGATSIQVRAVGWQTSAPLPIEGSPLRVELEHAGGVHGRILGPNGAGLAKVSVHLQATGIESPPPVVSTADGSFQFVGVQPSGYRLLAKSGGHILATADIVVHDNRDQKQQLLRVDKLPGLHVLAYDGDAGPASATSISVECTTIGGVTRRTASANVDGYAHIGGLLPGLYTVKAKIGGRTAMSLVNLSLDDEEPLVELTLR